MDEDGETILFDLTKIGQKVIIAKGGNGGFGNLYFKSSTNQAPRRANAGLAGVERELWLNLKLIAEVGLVGLPNAGKSTFLCETTNAHPKIADYAFTTLYPSLGVAQIDNDQFVIADIPGLIEGAHEGRGIGDRFLGHIERCAVLLHIVDGTSDSIGQDYNTIMHELEAYGSGLINKPRVTVLNKIDELDEDDLDFALSALRGVSGGLPILAMSGGTGEGTAEVLRTLATQIQIVHSEDPEAPLWRP
jgi:GTP-binding protein